MESQRERLKREARSKIDLTYYEFFLERDIESLKSFIENGEQWIVLEEKKLHKKLAKWKKERLKYEDAPEPFDMYETEILNFGNYRDILYNSSFVTAYSIFENQLKVLCLQLEKYNKSKIKLTDIKGKGYINQCKNYIEKVIEINLTDLNKLWEIITFYQKIRNIITHSGNSIEKSNQDFTKNKFKIKGISFGTKNNLITIESKDFIEYFLSISNQYLENIINKIHLTQNSPVK